MAPPQPYDTIPWELVESALRGELAPADDARLQEWLSASAETRSVYERLQELWKAGLADYPAYLDADADRGWTHLREKISMEKPMTQPPGISRPVISRYLAAAAVLVLVVGGGWWFLANRTGTQV